MTFHLYAHDDGKLHLTPQVNDEEKLAIEKLNAIDEMHFADAAPEHDPQCVECNNPWPCRTHRMIHPKEKQS